MKTEMTDKIMNRPKQWEGVVEQARRSKKELCRTCGNSGRLPKLGVHEPKDWPLCSCEFGERLRKKGES